jgi:hypothetical protein
MLIDEMGMLNDEMGNAGSSHDKTKPLQNNGQQYTTAKKICRGVHIVETSKTVTKCPFNVKTHAD